MPIPLLFNSRIARTIQSLPDNQKTITESRLHAAKGAVATRTAPQNYVTSPVQARKLAVKELMGRKDQRSKLLAITIALSARGALGPSFVFGTLYDYIELPLSITSTYTPEDLRRVNGRFINASRFLRGQEAKFFLSGIEPQRRDAILTEPWALYIDRAAAELGRITTGDLCVEAYEEPPKDTNRPTFEPVPGRLSATAKDMARKFGRHL